MKKIFDRIKFWAHCSRAFSLPMTIITWLVIFLWALTKGGNAINGLIALIGICFAHLATNLLDDYLDYKLLPKGQKTVLNAQRCKCAYIMDGSTNLNQVLRVIIFYCAIASVIGLILLFRAGIGVLWLGIIGALITLLYQKFSMRGLSEFMVFIAFGPLMFEGVYYVMKGTFSLEVLILSIAVVMFTVGVLYAHTVLDFECDMAAHKKTLCCRIGDKNKAMKLLGTFYADGYIMTALLAILSGNYYLFITFLTVPLAVSTYIETQRFNKDRMPVVHWWNLPFENQEFYKKEGSFPFYFAIVQSRNLMTYYGILMCIAILLQTVQR